MYILADFSNAARRMLTRTKQAELLGGLGKKITDVKLPPKLDEKRKLFESRIREQERALNPSGFWREKLDPSTTKMVRERIDSYKQDIKDLYPNREYIDAIQIARRGETTPGSGRKYLTTDKTRLGSVKPPLRNKKGTNDVEPNIKKPRTKRKLDLTGLDVSSAYSYNSSSDFGYKPLKLVAGTKRYNKTIKALGDAQDKFTEKAKKIAINRQGNAIEIQGIRTGIAPLEKARDIQDLKKKGFRNYEALNTTRFDNTKPSDLDTTKSRRFLPFNPKPDSSLNEKSPIARITDLSAESFKKLTDQQKANIKAGKANIARRNLAMDGLSQQLMNPKATAKDRNKAYRTYDRVSSKKFKPVED